MLFISTPSARCVVQVSVKCFIYPLVILNIVGSNHLIVFSGKYNSFSMIPARSGTAVTVAFLPAFNNLSVIFLSILA